MPLLLILSTIAAVVGAGANAVSAVSDTAGEVAASADAFTELYNEIDSDLKLPKTVKSSFEKFEKLRDLPTKRATQKKRLSSFQLTQETEKMGKIFNYFKDHHACSACRKTRS